MVTPTEVRRHPRADNVALSDEPHEKYFDCGIPILSNTPVGQVIDKSVTRKTTYCPECDVPARKFDGETLCPLCGLICEGKDSKSQELVIDAKAAGRVNNSGASSA